MNNFSIWCAIPYLISSVLFVVIQTPGLFLTRPLCYQMARYIPNKTIWSLWQPTHLRMLARKSRARFNVFTKQEAMPR